MNISTTNPYQAVSNVNHYSSIKATATQTASNTNEPIDTATISAQGQALSQDSDYQKLAIQDFLNWKNSDNKVAAGYTIKPIAQLLPENQKLIAQLKAQEKNMSPDEKKLTEYSRIPTIQAYGDKEVFTSASDADKRGKAQSQTMSLELAYLKKTGQLKNLSNTDLNGAIPKLGDLTGYINTTVSQKSKDLSAMLESSPLSKFDDPNFLADYLKQAYDSDYYQQPAAYRAPWEK